MPWLIWPLGNMAITASVLMVIAVSYERYLAICSPLQYKPSPSFYVGIVACLSVSANFCRFFEFELRTREGEWEVKAIMAHTSQRQTSFQGPMEKFCTTTRKRR